MKIITKIFVVIICFSLKTSLMAQSANEIWTAVCSQDPRGERLRCIEHMPDGFLLGGDKGISNERTIWILRLAADGTITKDWEIPVSVNEVLSVVPVEDGRVVVAASWNRNLRILVVSAEGLVEKEMELSIPTASFGEGGFVKMLLTEDNILNIAWNSKLPTGLSKSKSKIDQYYLDGRLKSTIEVDAQIHDIVMHPMGALFCLTESEVLYRGLSLQMFIPTFGWEVLKLTGDESLTGNGRFSRGRLNLTAENQIAVAAFNSDSYIPVARFWMIDGRGEKILKDVQMVMPEGGYHIRTNESANTFLCVQTSLQQPKFYVSKLSNDFIPSPPEEITGGIFYPADVCEDANGNYVIAGFSRRSVADFPEVICVRKK